MGSYYTGIEGGLSVDGKSIGKVREWQFAGEVEAVATTNLGDYAQNYIAGRQKHGGSCTLFWYVNTDGVLESRPLIGAIMRTGHVDPDKKFRLRLSSADQVLEFDALITSVSTMSKAGDVMSASISFAVCGELAQVSLGGL